MTGPIEPRRGPAELGHRLWRAAVEGLFPPSCVACDAAGSPICDTCAAGLREPPPDAVPDGLDDLVAVCSYEGTGRDLVLALKRRNRRDAVPLLAESLAAALPPLPGGSAAVTWPPTTDRRRRARGFDQSAVLARAVAQALHLPRTALLQRVDDHPQHGRERVDRVSGPVFRAGPAPPVLVLVDDVVTSGATMSAAAGALRDSGASVVVGLAVARSSGTAVVRDRAR